MGVYFQPLEDQKVSFGYMMEWGGRVKQEQIVSLYFTNSIENRGRPMCLRGGNLERRVCIVASDEQAAGGSHIIYEREKEGTA